MEEERGIGNIIFYIILAIIAIVSSIKGKKKQQGTPGGPAPSQQGRSYFPDELFEDDVDDEATQRGYWEKPMARETVITSESRPSQVFSGEMEGSYDEPMASMFAGEGVSALDHMATSRRFEELLRETSTNDGFDWAASEKDGFEDGAGIDLELLPEEFDGRQAVILAEIINRKEY